VWNVRERIDSVNATQFAKPAQGRGGGASALPSGRLFALPPPGACLDGFSDPEPGDGTSSQPSRRSHRRASSTTAWSSVSSWPSSSRRKLRHRRVDRPVHPTRHPGLDPFRQRPGVRRRGRAPVERCGGGPAQASSSRDRPGNWAGGGVRQAPSIKSNCRHELSATARQDAGARPRV